MPIMVLAAGLLCGLLFVVYTLVRYFEAVSPLKQAVPQLRTAVDAKQSRLTEYEQRIKDLKDLIPYEEARLARMQTWVESLTQQNERLKALEAERAQKELEKQIPIEKEDG